MKATYSPFSRPWTKEVRLPDHRIAEVSYDLDGNFITHEGTISPTRFSYREELPNGTRWLVEFTHDDQRLPIVAAIHIERAPGAAGLTNAGLGMLRNLQDLVEDAWMLASRPASRSHGDTSGLPSMTVSPELDLRMKRTIRGLRKQSRAKTTPARLEEVARIYATNYSSGAPVKAVMSALGMAQSTAFRNVARARSAGLLPPLETTDKAEGE